MNPNMPYGHVPMQPGRGRHEMPYTQMPPHMRPHPAAYQQYYPQPMGPMMPQYQHYPQSWYPYQHHMNPHPSVRHNYYPPSPAPYPQHQMQQQHAQMVAPSPQQQSHVHASPRHGHSQSPFPPTHPSSTTSSVSAPQIHTPPSRPISTASGNNIRKDATPPITPSATRSPAVEAPILETPIIQEPFHPPVPWLSVQGEAFPIRAKSSRRRILRSTLGTEPITFPISDVSEGSDTPDVQHDGSKDKDSTHESVLLTPSKTSTSLASDAPSDSVSTQPTTPSSATPLTQSTSLTTPTQPKAVKAAIPVVPVVPIIPSSFQAPRVHRDSAVSDTSTVNNILPTSTISSESTSVTGEPAQAENPAIIPTPLPPTSWAALLRNKASANATAAGTSGAIAVADGLTVSKSETLGDVLLEININEIPSKLSFLQPRGLVNTGNMCYMNSVVQMLVFCIPFYDFLDRVAKRAPHTFKSNTPLIDAMILFMREFPAIDTASSVEQLRLRLKPEDYERYGESFIPEYVYNVIKQLPRFRDMRRGHQQDAQEFLGFLLEELHEECASAMKSGTADSSGRSTPVGSGSNVSDVPEADNGWMEVGHKQKAAVTRSSGAIVTESPITNIFGGKLRSELKVSGNKLSVTLEPYQPLQLDIGSPQINNIIDALQGLTRPESMQGDFQSARGLKTSATKQVFIETLPPVLILHLKRFHYDSDTKRAEKIWKKVGYPLELEMPKEVFPTSARNKYAAHGGLPKYRLIGVIYHHGKNASGGHYTVDICRQDGKEWIRIDDTHIRRVRSEDVAEGGSEEDPKILAAALEQHKQAKQTTNRFEQIDDEENYGGSDKVWSQVNGHSRSKSTMSAVVNGSMTPSQDTSGPQTPRDRFSVKDNKVAYLLFYERI